MAASTCAVPCPRAGNRGVRNLIDCSVYRAGAQCHAERITVVLGRGSNGGQRDAMEHAEAKEFLAA